MTFALDVSVLFPSTRSSEALPARLLLCHTFTDPNSALWALQVINLQRGSYFENAAVICCVAQLHLWTDLQLLRTDYTHAYETSVSSSNWDVRPSRRAPLPPFERSG